MPSSSAAAPLFGHDHVALVVEDLLVSSAFYEHLGGRVVSRPSSRFREIVLGDVRLHLVPAHDPTHVEVELDRPVGSRPRPTRIDHLCLRVASFEALRSVQERVNAFPMAGNRSRCEVEDSPPRDEAGASHVEECPPRKTLYFADPDGIRLEVRAYD